jgi:FTR1 family protein
MGAAFIVALREGIEAALIVSILLAYLKQLGRMDRAHLIWWGTALAVAISAAVGTAIFALGAEFEGTTEEVFEGLVTLAAVGVLTWMIFWMRRQGARIKSDLQEKVDTALVAGGLALAALAFTAVLREGIETALFLFAAAKGTAVEAGGVGQQLAGALLGLTLAVGLGVLLYRGGIRPADVPKVTGSTVVVAAGLFAYPSWLRGRMVPVPHVDGSICPRRPRRRRLGAVLRGLVGYNASVSLSRRARVPRRRRHALPPASARGRPASRRDRRVLRPLNRIRSERPSVCHSFFVARSDGTTCGAAR